MTTKQQLWSERVAAWQASGKTSEEFCRGSEFKPLQLRHWASLLRRLAARGAAQGGGGVRVAPVILRRGRRPKALGADLQSRPAPDGSPLTLEIGQVRIAVRRGFDREALAAVLQVLQVGGPR
jgi:hypothetical protein